jgi:hypothetical protein
VFLEHGHIFVADVLYPAIRMMNEVGLRASLDDRLLGRLFGQRGQQTSCEMPSNDRPRVDVGTIAK